MPSLVRKACIRAIPSAETYIRAISSVESLYSCHSQLRKDYSCHPYSAKSTNAKSLYCTLGWSEFHFSAIFENGHNAVDWLYIYEFNSKACTRDIPSVKSLHLYHPQCKKPVLVPILQCDKPTLVPSLVRKAYTLVSSRTKSLFSCHPQCEKPTLVPSLVRKAFTRVIPSCHLAVSCGQVTNLVTHSLQADICQPTFYYYSSPIVYST